MGILNDTLSNIWQGKPEEDVHNCLIEAYENKNYKVTHVHKLRSKGEGAIDIKCQKKDQILIFQVKKSPKPKDIEQLEEFTSRKASRRIYVYIEEPRTRFQSSMRKVQDKVEFWNKQKLHAELVRKESLTYLRYLIQSTSLVRNMTNILDILYKNKSSNYKGIKLSPQHYKFLWKIKDDAVKLNTSLELCHSHWERILKRKTTLSEDENIRIIEEILLDLYYVDAIACEHLVISCTDASKSHQWILGCMWSVIRGRSNWHFYRPLHSESLSKEERLSATLEWLVPESEAAGFYSTLEGILFELYQRAEAIEDGIDWVFEDFNEGEAYRKSKI